MPSHRLTDQNKTNQAAFRRFAAEHVAPFADEFDRAQAISDDVVGALRNHRYLGSHLPDEHGGLSLDSISYGLLHLEVGKKCSSVRSLLTVHDMVAEVILKVGSSEQKKEWLPRLASGATLGSFALSEPGAGSDANGIATHAVETGRGYVLNGAKKWISFGQLADVFLIMARIGEQGPVGAFLVERDNPGLAILPMTGMLGLRASMLAELELVNCEVSAAAKIGGSGLSSGYATAAGLNLGRYTVAWGCVAIGEAAAEAAFTYSGAREQFGVPIVQHQLIRRLLTNIVADVRAAELLCIDAGALTDDRDPKAIQATLIAKYFASRMASRVASDAVQIHGALGLSDQLPIERLFRDARVMEIIEGSSQIQQITIAGHARRAYAASPDENEVT